MKRYILFLLIAFTTTSCSELMDAPSDGRVNIEEIFIYEKRTNDRLYDNFALFQTVVADQGFLYGDRMLASYCDEAHEANYNSDATDWYNGKTSSANNPGEGPRWSRLFEGIREANLSLFYLTQKDLPITYSLVKKQGFIAQYYTMRAYFYLTLIKRYGGVPIMREPYDLNHDYTKDKRASFAQCVDFIIESCDSALNATTDLTPSGFQWRLNSSDKKYNFTRAVAWAIKSQAALYAASPLWQENYEGTKKYTWDRVVKITKDALDVCLANGYKLFDTTTSFKVKGVNCYDSYFLSEPSYGDDRDKETIYANARLSERTKVWQMCGLPIVNGQVSAGSCPTQELIDSYEVLSSDKRSSANLLDLSNPYINDDHTRPNITSVALGFGYEDGNSKMYKNRDPRFYATIYYNGAPRKDDFKEKIETHTTGNCAISTSIENSKNTKTGYYLRKYLNPESNSDNQVDGYFRTFRLTELYMNFAEAAFKASSDNADVKIAGSSLANGSASLSARDAVNAVRSRVGMPNITENGAQFWARYCNERRVEFAFEEHRYFDVRRWSTYEHNLLENTDKAVSSVVITKNADIESFKRVLLTERNCYDSKYLLLPINLYEAIKMQNLTGQNWQNRGW